MTIGVYRRYMPLPRFHRLPQQKRAAILATAARRFASEGPDRASYNAILSDAGISKASAYQYFDSRADLLDAVLGETASELLHILGPWRPSADVDDFAAQWRAGAERLIDALRSDQVLLALAPHCLRRLPQTAGPHTWLAVVIGDGQRIGAVRTDRPTGLLLAASAAVLESIDTWFLSELDAGRRPDPETGYGLLESLWTEKS